VTSALDYCFLVWRSKARLVRTQHKEEELVEESEEEEVEPVRTDSY